MLQKKLDVYREDNVVPNQMRKASTGGTYNCISVLMALPEYVVKIAIVPAGKSISNLSEKLPTPMSEMTLWLESQSSDQIEALGVDKLDFMLSMMPYGFYQTFVDAKAIVSGKGEDVGFVIR
ncbi:MAG: hypothetical protein M0Z90_03530 [Desulfobacteraceae bacterium]|nr:hypothetical protein [Desulfobacteraceae bacterium]